MITFEVIQNGVTGIMLPTELDAKKHFLLNADGKTVTIPKSKIKEIKNATSLNLKPDSFSQMPFEMIDKWYDDKGHFFAFEYYLRGNKLSKLKAKLTDVFEAYKVSSLLICLQTTREDSFPDDYALALREFLTFSREDSPIMLRTIEDCKNKQDAIYVYVLAFGKSLF